MWVSIRNYCERPHCSVGDVVAMMPPPHQVYLLYDIPFYNQHIIHSSNTFALDI